MKEKPRAFNLAWIEYKGGMYMLGAVSPKACLPEDIELPKPPPGATDHNRAMLDDGGIIHIDRFLNAGRWYYSRHPVER